MIFLGQFEGSSRPGYDWKNWYPKNDDLKKDSSPEDGSNTDGSPITGGFDILAQMVSDAIAGVSNQLPNK